MENGEAGFDKNDETKDGKSSCNDTINTTKHTIFRLACGCFGNETILPVIQKQISHLLLGETNVGFSRTNMGDSNHSTASTSSTTSPTTTLQSLVVAAATNPQISLDGLYLLVLRDPDALLRTRTTTLD